MLFLDKVIHFEIPVDNLERAQKFYKQGFGWIITPVPELEYTLLSTVEVDENNMPKEHGAVNGGMMQRSEEIKCPVLTIGVENIDKALKVIESLGGRIVQGKMEVPNMGITAYFKDSEGNVLGLWQATQTQ
jgi:predicted enzyme related to lactoylglutathione lyase